MAILVFERVSHRIGSDLVLDNVSFNIREREIIVVRGRTGVGKTTLARIAALIIKPTSGKVVFLNHVMNELSNDERARLRLKYIGYVDQHYRLIPNITIIENIMLPLRLLGINKDKALKEAREIMKALGIHETGNRYPSQVSGGQRQRAALARAIVKKPKLIVADEPFSNLDDETAENVYGFLRSYVRTHDAGLLVTTTDLISSFECSREYILKYGKLSMVKKK